jgi:hypothetical protein
VPSLGLEKQATHLPELFRHHVDQFFRPVVDPLLFLVGELLLNPAPIFDAVVSEVCVHGCLSN